MVRWIVLSMWIRYSWLTVSFSSVPFLITCLIVLLIIGEVAKASAVMVGLLFLLSVLLVFTSSILKLSCSVCTHLRSLFSWCIHLFYHYIMFLLFLVILFVTKSASSGNNTATSDFLLLLSVCTFSWSCCNKASQSMWLKITIYSLAVLEARSLRSRCHRAASEGSREQSFLTSPKL